MRPAHRSGEAEPLAGLLGDPDRTPPSRRLLRAFRRRLDRLRADLRDAVIRVDRAAGPELTAGSEWLLDNRFLVFRAIDQVLGDLPAGFFAVLPRTREDPVTPRIERLSTELVAGGDGYVDDEAVLGFIRRFQTVAPLDMAELWALPAFLRIVVLERLLESLRSEQPAAGVGGGDIAAAITSLRAIDQADWKAIFESLSVVERCFRRLDPCRAYDDMDFATRDRYRQAVEELARWSGVPELRVALEVVRLARVEAPHGRIGLWLIGHRRKEIEAGLGARLPLANQARRLLFRNAGRFYFGLVGLLTLAGAALPLWPLGGAGVHPLLLVLATLLVLPPAVSVAVAAVNLLATRIVPPRALPKMDFSSGIPASRRTCVAIPTILSDLREVDAVLRQLEMNYLGNADENLVFVLLGDPPDADAEVIADDAVTLTAAEEGVRGLNQRYGRDGATPFLLMVRPRRWNWREGRWMAWERKRGKLQELNRLLLGDRDIDLHLHVGDPGALDGARYVLTLDADTFLPQGVAARLAGTLAHPLNESRFDEQGRVTTGYTVLQPRVETLLESGAGTWFSRIYQADEGLDLYSHAVSDIYQDLFAEGIYVGKGIYDVGSFERSLAGRVPHDALLSHDLFEGVHGRAALVSDVTVIEDFPPSPAAYMRRLHRWVRGDWQLLPWLFPHVPSTSGVRLPNRLSPLGRWMIADNLRRSLVFPALLGLLVAGWFVLPGSLAWWTGWAIAFPGIPVLLAGLSGATTRWRRRPRSLLFRRSAPRGLIALAHWAAAVLFLPWRAVVELDAVARTLYRLAISHRHMLEWTTAAHTTRSLAGRSGLASSVRQAAPGLLVAAVLGSGLWLARPSGSGAAALVGAWLVSPLAAWLLARPRRRRRGELSRTQILWLRRLARRSWVYFERLTTPEDHWLPPDNLQVDPDRGLAHRTSPTNIGMGALAVAVAHDLGYLSLTRAAAGLTNLFETLDRLEHHRGHLLNWYSTRDLHPLAPRYVSSVDSGNLAACLVALGESLADFQGAGYPRAADATGLADTLAVSAAAFQEAGLGPHGTSAAQTLERLGERLEARRDDPVALVAILDELRGLVLPPLERATADLMEAEGAAAGGGEIADLRWWLDALHRQVQQMDQETRRLRPWLRVLAAPPALLANDRAGTRPGRAWSNLRAAVPPRATLAEAALIAERLREPLATLRAAVVVAPADAAERRDALSWIGSLQREVDAAPAHAAELSLQLETLRTMVADRVGRMDFRFLYDDRRRLLHVGYNVDSAALDRSYYDLYASEARLASYVGMAKGDLPVEHWLRLGRPFSRRDGAVLLMSWAGTMFEYLMPSLFLRTPDGSLSDTGGRRAVEAQIDFGYRHNVPWGISESAYPELDAHAGYRYRAFGVPALALRRDTGDKRIVVAPYATALALPQRPVVALRNLKRLARDGMLGPLGFFESAAYGPGGRSGGMRIVRSVMAHHQGMLLASLHDVLSDGATVDRFHRDKTMAALEYLLHEEAPGRVRATAGRHAPALDAVPVPTRRVAAPPWAVSAEVWPPPAMVVGNGSLSTLLTASGSGGLRWRGRDILRWRPDPTAQAWGLWIYVRDTETDRVWSAGRAPTWAPCDRYEVLFAGERIEIHRDDGPLKMRTAVAVSPSADIEIRRVTVVNEGDRAHTLEFTSMGEVALAAPSEDRRHPAFARLFVEGELVSGADTLVFGKRAEGLDEPPLFLAHAVTAPDGDLVGWEMDRSRFLGRAPDRSAPPGVLNPRRHDRENEAWAPLDPVASLTWRITVPPGAERSLGFLTTAGPTRESVLETIASYRSGGRLQWALDQSGERERDLQHELDIEPDDLPAFHRLLTALVFPFHRLRRPAGPPGVEAQTRGQEALWSIGVSGDVPVVVAMARVPQDGTLLPSLLKAHAYWERRGVEFDLVVVGRETDGYAEPLGGWLARALARNGRSDRLNRPAGIHYLPATRLRSDEMRMLARAASLFLDGADGSLADALTGLERDPDALPSFVPVPSAPLEAYPRETLGTPTDLAFFNGLGGFPRDGTGYAIHLEPGMRPPAPWINVVANRDFGFTVSESGTGFTWDGNSGERRLTPWSNDPILDPAGEAFYLRDEETGDIWSPTPGPAGADAAHRVLHRAGATSFRHRSHGLDQDVVLFVPRDDRTKVMEVTLRNRWSRLRRLTLTYYAEWVLGARRSLTAPHLVTALDRDEGAILAWNGFHPAPIGFIASDAPIHGFTCDRSEFLGPEGRRERPAGLFRIGLTGATGEGLDPCTALQVHVDLRPDEQRTMRFFLGALDRHAELTDRLASLRDPDAVGRTRAEALGFWCSLLGRTTVRTPEPSMDLMLNGWLRYQALACRLWGRSGFYQSSGAFGFRDQLQDGLGLLNGAPGACRERIVEAASRQFQEGDVLHWWHPQSGAGVRTRCSDDRLWLPYVVATYLRVTGDRPVLDETVPFLVAPPLGRDEIERYDTYRAEGEPASIYEHCLRALDRPGMIGPRGIPLIGSGDWNDGLNRVGVRGQGESFWLSWFLARVCRDFADVCEGRGDAGRAERLRQRAETLRSAMEAHGWDGAWYRRATYDDGAVLGSAKSLEGRIDSLTQSWAVLSGVGDPERSRIALESVWRALVDPDNRLVLLLEPPFHETPRHPGYIKSYPPGVRENGGQYTHAAAWVGWALAAMGDGDRAEEVFRILNPILRTDTAAGMDRYRAEPYVVAGDVYAGPHHTGRGGWSWYTGSSSWLYRLGIEAILGLRFVPGGLEIDPCIPRRWKRFVARHRHGSASYHILVKNPSGLCRGVRCVTLDGRTVEGSAIPVEDDGRHHHVVVVMGDG